MTESVTNEMHEQVWTLVEGTGISVNPTVVSAYDDVVTDLLSKSLTPEDVSSHVVLAIRRQWHSFKAGMEAFEVLCECLKFAAELDQGAPDPMDSLSHVVTTKAGLAVFYDQLAQMAPYAGVEGLDTETTAQERREAIAERDELLAKIAAARSDNQDSPE